MTTKLEVTQLRNSLVVRPERACGTCGFYPKAWQVAVMRKRDNAATAFLRANKNWSKDDLQA
jgi:hypothetical protein